MSISKISNVNICGDACNAQEKLGYKVTETALLLEKTQIKKIPNISSLMWEMKDSYMGSHVCSTKRAAQEGQAGKVYFRSQRI